MAELCFWCCTEAHPSHRKQQNQGKFLSRNLFSLNHLGIHVFAERHVGAVIVRCTYKPQLPVFGGGSRGFYLRRLLRVRSGVEGHIIMKPRSVFELQIIAHCLRVVCLCAAHLSCVLAGFVVCKQHTSLNTPSSHPLPHRLSLSLSLLFRLPHLSLSLPPLPPCTPLFEELLLPGCTCRQQAWHNAMPSGYAVFKQTCPH